MVRLSKVLAVAASLAALSACGGGGGDGGGGVPAGGEGMTVTPASVTFTVLRNASLPPSQSVQITITGQVAVFAAGWPPSNPTGTSWLNMNAFGSGQSYTLTLGVNTTGLALGTHTTVVRAGAERTDGSVVYRDIPVTYNVRSIVTSPATVVRSYVIGGAAPATAAITVQGQAGTAWTATPNQGWLTVSPTSGVIGGAGTTLAVNPGSLGIGQHHGAVTFSGGGGSATLDVTLTVTAPALTATPATLQLAGASGHDLGPKPLRISLDTGTNAYPWTAAAADAWVELSVTSGTVSATPVSILVTPRADAAAWAPGTYPSTITVTANVNGNLLTRQVAVSYRLDDERLRVSEEGVAFASMPGLSSLTRELRVDTNRGLPVSWSATADQDWVILATTSGTTADPLVLAADPGLVATGTVHEATVTVTSEDAGITNVETVRVGLWVGETTPEPITTVSVAYKEIATDPIRPYAYVHSEGTDVKVYNVHTGALVDTIPAVGTTLGAMTVSGDGSRLFVADRGTSPQRIVPVDLPSRTVATGWNLPAWTSWTRLAYARANGVRLVLDSHGMVRNAATGASYSRTFGVMYDPAAAVATSRNGSRVCALHLNANPYMVRCYALDFTALAGVASPLVIGTGKDAMSSFVANGQDVAVSADGSRAYVAARSGGTVPYSFIAYDAAGDGTTMAVLDELPGAAYPMAVEVGSDDRVYCGADTGGTSTWIYDGAGALQSSRALGWVAARGLAVSGDALRMGVLTGTSLKLVTVAP